jgi:hypothetical protein
VRRPGTDSQPLEAEIVDERYEQRRQNAQADDVIERLAWLMDRSIGIGGLRIGLDPIIGLIPGFGDVFGALVSTMIITQAYRAGVPKPTVLRMVANTGIDAALGAIPFVGDLFDFAFKANTRNLELYRASVRGHHSQSRDWGFLALVLIGLAVIISIPLVLAILAIRAIF